MNNVILIGNLTRDPELSYTPQNQTAVCNFTIAVNRPKKEGQDQGADYPRIIVWGKQAENCSNYLAKGRKVAVRGRIQTGSYKDRDGRTVYTTDVVADNVEFLTSPQGDNLSRGARNDDPRGNHTPQRNDVPQGGYEGVNGWNETDDDLPY